MLVATFKPRIYRLLILKIWMFYMNYVRNFQDEEGKICDMTVLARPPNAVAALKDAMMKNVPPRMMAMKAKQAVKGIFGK